MDYSTLHKYENCYQYKGFIPEIIKLRNLPAQLHEIVDKLLNFNDYDRPIVEYLVDARFCEMFYKCSLFDRHEMGKIKDELPNLLLPIEPALVGEDFTGENDLSVEVVTL